MLVSAVLPISDKLPALLAKLPTVVKLDNEMSVKVLSSIVRESLTVAREGMFNLATLRKVMSAAQMSLGNSTSS